LADLADLADRYEQARRQTTPGPERTAALNAVCAMLCRRADAAADLGEWHLSPQAGLRLVAILELQQRPRDDYLRWLSERVTIEKPFLGMQAAIALRGAAERNEIDPEQVMAAVTDALTRLAELPDGGARRAHLHAALAALRRRLNEPTRIEKDEETRL
jgi:hypothetical protein